MKLRTEIEPLRMAGAITHHTPVMLIGSCFSDNIGERLTNRLFPTLINPFGTLYNPLSIELALTRIVDNKPFDKADLIFDPVTGLYHSFWLHSSFSSKDPETILSNANSALAHARDFLGNAKWLVITLGTSYRFTHTATGMTVANCHKLPAAAFSRTMLRPEESAQSLIRTVNRVRQINAGINLLFTVSPIRHLADGLHGNNLSKSALLLATDIACNSLGNCSYFPSYEIVIDDLRDYRFYASDMKHPSETAVDYIFEIFEKSFFNRKTTELCRQALSFTSQLKHRPIAAGRAAYEAGLRDIINQFVQLHPDMEQSVHNFILCLQNLTK